jgi:hypothetical protein
MMRLQQHQ